MLAGCQMDIQAWNDAKTTWRTPSAASPIRASPPRQKLQLAQLQLMH